MSACLSSAIPIFLPQTCFRWLLELISNLSFPRTEIAPSLASSPIRTWRSSSPGQVPLIPTVNCTLNFTSVSSQLFHCSIQASEEETQERRKREEGRRWRGCCRNPDWGKCWAAEVGRGEAERATESQIRRHPCKGGGREQLKASQNYLAIMIVMGAKLLLLCYYDYNYFCWYRIWFSTILNQDLIYPW